MPTNTPWHPLIACSLFIVPGIPLINAIDDLVDNYITAWNDKGDKYFIDDRKYDFWHSFCHKIMCSSRFYKLEYFF